MEIFHIAFKPIWTRCLMISWLWCVKFDASGNNLPWNPLRWLPHGIYRTRLPARRSPKRSPRRFQGFEVNGHPLVGSAWDRDKISMMCLYQVISGHIRSNRQSIRHSRSCSNGRRTSRLGEKVEERSQGSGHMWRKKLVTQPFCWDIRSDIRISYPYYVDLYYLYLICCATFISQYGATFWEWLI